jgi:hypothetical protein
MSPPDLDIPNDKAQPLARRAESYREGSLAVQNVRPEFVCSIRKGHSEGGYHSRVVPSFDCPNTIHNETANPPVPLGLRLAHKQGWPVNLTYNGLTAEVSYGPNVGGDHSSSFIPALAQT